VGLQLNIDFAGDTAKAIVGAAPIIFGPRIRDFLPRGPPTAVCAAFIKESRLKTANAAKLNRKFGAR
jgi:hypothetical protein